MARTIRIGQQNFAALRENDGFYIDKTDFIKEWWERGDYVTSITRPGGFGKTLNISMVECFFSVKYAGRGDLFEGLSIWEDEKFRRLQGDISGDPSFFCRCERGYLRENKEENLQDY